MKEFSDFLASVSEETIVAIMNDTSLKASEVKEKMGKNNQDYLGHQIQEAAFTIALELLGLCHQWVYSEES